MNKILNNTEIPPCFIYRVMRSIYWWIYGTIKLFYFKHKTIKYIKTNQDKEIIKLFKNNGLKIKNNKNGTYEIKS